ncbi:hypothetical protein EK904_003948 [Melospiza melodia maxima]|nr:hypothetical protein EK904_003948 [Melospiza melodia maxima]
MMCPTYTSLSVKRNTKGQITDGSQNHIFWSPYLPAQNERCYKGQQKACLEGPRTITALNRMRFQLLRCRFTLLSLKGCVGDQRKLLVLPARDAEESRNRWIRSSAFSDTTFQTLKQVLPVIISPAMYEHSQVQGQVFQEVTASYPFRKSLQVIPVTRAGSVL